jgi:hypothetical protein
MLWIAQLSVFSTEPGASPCSFSCESTQKSTKGLGTSSCVSNSLERGSIWLAEHGMPGTLKPTLPANESMVFPLKTAHAIRRRRKRCSEGSVLEDAFAIRNPESRGVQVVHGILHQSQQRHTPESASQQHLTYMERLFAPCVIVGVVALQVIVAPRERCGR